MGILIDGYNLLNATGVEGTGRGTELERARRGLLQFLSRALTADESSATTIVFDAQGAPPGLPIQESFQGITVLFSKGYAEADDLLEELIAADHVPRKLVVVSSDHRLHRAARRRKATPIDSEVWIAELASRRSEYDKNTSAEESVEPQLNDIWLAEFSDVDVSTIERQIEQEDELASPRSDDDSHPPSVAPSDHQSEESLGDKTSKKEDTCPFPEDFGSELDDEGWGDLFNPFPPGFGDELDES